VVAPVEPAVAIGPRVLRPLVETIGVLGDEPDRDRRVWAICKRFDADVATGELLAFLADPSFESRAWRSFKAGDFDASTTGDRAVRRGRLCALQVLEDLITDCSRPETWAAALLDEAEAWRLEGGAGDFLGDGIKRATRGAVAARGVPMPPPALSAVERWHATQAAKAAADVEQRREAARRAQLDEDMAALYYYHHVIRKEGGSGCLLAVAFVVAAAALCP